MVAMPVPAPLPSGGPRLGSTWRDVGAPTTQSVWNTLRSMRHKPPGAAQSDQLRGEVFGAALEQSEQLFRAAAGVGYETRPLLLFYGLSQAGRAIAAASTAAGPADWDKEGHGINIRGLKSRLPLGDYTVESRPGGLFSGLSELLRSSSLPQGTRLAQVWSLLPELANTPITRKNNGKIYPFLSFENFSIRPNPPGPADVLGWLDGAPKKFLDSDKQGGVDEFLSQYPTLAGHQPSGPGMQFAVPGAYGSAKLSRSWPGPADGNMEAFFESLSSPYLGDNDRRIFPCLDGSQMPVHPLLAWWALLYSLSMFARYVPATWGDLISIDSSPDAAQLERALDIALSVCPELIRYAIRSVSA